MITYDQTIMAGPHVDAAYLTKWGMKYGTLSSPAAARIAEVYTVFGELTHIGNVLPYAQAAKETSWFKSSRWVQSYNPAGLGATNDGAWGSHFNNPAEGVLAQYAHLISYAVNPEAYTYLQRGLIAFDPRYSNMPKVWLGASPRWVDLNAKWASPGTNYGNTIIDRANTFLAGIPASEIRAAA